jgi:streptogramin lyase
MRATLLSLLLISAAVATSGCPNLPTSPEAGFVAAKGHWTQLSDQRGPDGDKVAVDDLDVAADGTVYFTEAYGHRLYRLAPQGRIELVAGAAGDGDHQDGTGTFARFDRPKELAIEADGTILVVDDAHLRRVTPAGKVTTQPVAWETSPEQADVQIEDLAIAPGGTRYALVGTYNNSQIAVLSSDGKLRPHATGLAYVTDMAAGPDGALYVVAGQPSGTVDPSGPPSRVLQVLPDGSTATPAWAEGLRDLQRITVDARGRVSVAFGDGWDMTEVRRVSPDGQAETIVTYDRELEKGDRVIGYGLLFTPAGPPKPSIIDTLAADPTGALVMTFHIFDGVYRFEGF